ncbi:MAG: tetratricopeptide repeat protein [Chitinophagaceae bacterium]|nr:MAG: tetratricopeptide repeat protein [Chitinophagaceae bacterium]
MCTNRHKYFSTGFCLLHKASKLCSLSFACKMGGFMYAGHLQIGVSRYNSFILYLEKMYPPMRRFLGILISLLVMLPGFSQNNPLDSLLNLLYKSKPDTNKVNLYIAISRQARFTDPQKAIEYGKDGFTLSKNLAFHKGTAGCYLNVSTAYSYSGNLDTALLFLDTAMAFAYKARDEKRLGLAYLNRADLYRQLDNYKQALLDCDTAISFADKTNDDDVRARVSQTFAAIYYRQKLYDQSILYYDKAIGLYRKTGNLRMSAAVLNNLGLIYKEIKDYSKASTVTLEAIRITDSLKDLTNLSFFNGNMADLYLLSKNYPLAMAYVDKAIEYATKQHHEMDMASAFSMKGHILNEQKRYAEALPYLQKAQPIYERLASIENAVNNADLLADAYAGTGNYSRSYEYMRFAKHVGDSLAVQRYDEHIAAMQTKFKVDEKDQEILLLAKNKELQQQRLKEKNLYIIASIAVAILALLGIWLAINRNRLRARMKELELRNQIAADLHDEVGSSLSSIHMLSQMATSKADVSEGQRNLLNKVSNNAKETMEKMSDIVWMIKPGETQSTDLAERMENFARDICSSRNIELTLSLDALEPLKLSTEQRKSVYLIFKEAINNAVKYADTKKIQVHTLVQNNQLLMTIRDWGKGFMEEGNAKGNGLHNMRQRATEANGQLTIQSTVESGTYISLNINL